MLRYLFLLLLSICFLFAKSQKSISPADFRLCIDSFGCSDSLLKITQKQLLNAKIVSANFTWFTITRLTFYFSSEFGTDATVQSCAGNMFCDKLKPFLERSGPGTVLTISAEGVNKSGKKVTWRDLSIKVVDISQ